MRALIAALFVMLFLPFNSFASHLNLIEQEELPYKEIHLNFSGYSGKTPALMVVSEKKSCDELFRRFKKMYGREAITTERLCNIINPKLDDRDGDLVLLIFQGWRPTTEGYSIKVNRVYLEDNILVVDVDFNGPSAQQLKKRTDASSPLVILKVKKGDINISDALGFKLVANKVSDKEARGFNGAGIALDNQDYNQRELLIKFKKNTPTILANTLMKRLGVKIMSKPPLTTGFYTVEVSEGATVEAVLEEVKKIPEVESVELKYVPTRSRIFK